MKEITNHVFHKTKENLNIKQYLIARFKPTLIGIAGITTLVTGFFTTIKLGYIGLAPIIAGFGMLGYSSLLKDHTQWARGI